MVKQQNQTFSQTWTTDSLRRSDRNWFRQGMTAAVGLVFVFGFVGCGGSKATVKDKDKQKQATEKEGSVLPSTLAMARPDRLEYDSKPEQVVMLLNLWRSKLPASRLPAALSKEEQQWISANTPAGTLEWVMKSQFQTDDIRRLRDAFLCREIGRRVGSLSTNEVENATAIFDYIARNVRLTDGNHPAFTPFETLFFGMGSARDRAWVFVEILRQLRIEARVLLPAESATDQPPQWLWVAVLIDDELYLFDPTLGTVVPSPEDVMQVTAGDHDAAATTTDQTQEALRPGEADGREAVRQVAGVWPSQPLTWSQAVADPQRLEPAVHGDAKIPTGAELKALRVASVGHPTLWSPRSALLTDVLRGDDRVVLHQDVPVGDDADVKQQILAASGDAWQPRNLVVWDYPLKQLEAFRNTPDAEYQRYRSPFDMPARVRDSGGTLEVIGNRRIHWQRRADQLLQDSTEAVRGFQALLFSLRQTLLNASMPAALSDQHKHALQDVAVWMGVSQAESNDWYDASARWLQYQNRYPNGHHADAVRIHLAHAYALQGAFVAAREQLAGIPDASPQKPLANYLTNRWVSQAERRLPQPKVDVSEDPSPNDGPSRAPARAERAKRNSAPGDQSANF